MKPDLDGGISRHFRSPNELAVFLIAQRQIRLAVVGAWAAAHGYEPEPLPQRETAIETMLYVHAAVRLSRYKAMEHRGERLPLTPGEALYIGAGLCGHQTQAFASLARSLGLEVRQVGFAFESEFGPETHATVEVVINGSWRFFDVTNCCYWGDEQEDVLGLDEVLLLEDRGEGHVANVPALMIGPHELAGRDPFAYLDGERWFLNFEDLVLA